MLSYLRVQQVGRLPPPAQSRTERSAMANLTGFLKENALFIVVLAVRIGQRPVPPSGGEIAPIQQGVISASDISNMSPRERASRLYDRVMRMHEERKADSIAFFAPMALAAYSAIPDVDDD